MKHRLRWIGVSVAAVVLLSALAGVFVLRSEWFRGKVRAWLVSSIESATGGRAEVGAFRFHWSAVRAEADSFVLHGTEPAGKPPLFRAASISVGLKIVSLWKRDIDIRSLDVEAPRIALIVDADGRTNLPQPKTQGRRGNAIATIFKLAIGRFRVEHGEFQVESHAVVPFAATGRNLQAALTYDAAGPRYLGNINIEPLDVAAPGVAQTAVAVAGSFALEPNRIAISDATFATGKSRLSLSGQIDNLAAPRGSFEFQARVDNGDAERIFETRLLDRGTAEVKGSARWRGGADVSVAGHLVGTGLEYHDATVRLHGFAVSGPLTSDLRTVTVRPMRLSGHVVLGSDSVPAEVTVAAAVLRGRDLELRQVSVEALGGNFTGAIGLRAFNRYTVDGAVAALDVRRVAGLVIPVPLPWDGTAGGSLQMEGSFANPRELHLMTALQIGPAPAGPPVEGEVTADWDSPSGILDLGHSRLSLPNSRVAFSGAVGRELSVHLETRDLRDLLPALGERAAALPLKLDGSAAVFDGRVSGNLDHPQIQGRLLAGAFTYEDRAFDALDTAVTASPDNLRLDRAALTRAGVRVQFSLAVALRDWEAADRSDIFGSATVHDAPLGELVAMAGGTPQSATGTLNAAISITGVVADPIVQAELDGSHGDIEGEPYDRITGHARYRGGTLDLSAGEIQAGAKQILVAASFAHSPGHFNTGALRFQLSTNAMPLDQVHLLAAARPGVRGSLQVRARGAVDIVLPENGGPGFRIQDLDAEVSAKNLQLAGGKLGDSHLTAETYGGALRAHLESNFADSSIVGDGHWRLTGDYPGSATIRFTKVDLEQLRAWLAPAGSLNGLAGAAEASLRLDGPVLNPREMTAELRITRLEIAPAASTGLAPAAFALRNSGDIVIAMAGPVVTVETGRLTGPDTDFRVTGRVSLERKNPLDVRVEGRVGLALVHELNRDLTASGVVKVDATVRGTLAAPQIAGRLEFAGAGFNISDVSNGISAANGVLLFNGDRASIQSFTGETGGGKIELSGFAVYGGEGQAVFRLHARALQVRVRYPEGVSTMANADLRFTGTTASSILSGTITVLRTGFSAQSDFSSLLAQSSEPVRTPAARTGLLGGLTYDIQVTTAPDVQVQSALTQDIQVEANLRLRGTYASPAVLGRVNITHGQVLFFGTRYSISQGSISFFNPVNVEPVLNIDLGTKVRGIQVTLNVSGPLSKLNLTPSSDPPLQFSEIVALLATGRTPTDEASLSSSENTAAPAWQQSAGSALLGQAISSPVTGRLQRFFGVSRLRIDPTLPGTEFNPQARLTLEQQVTPDITFTYITDVTTSNPQVVSVEWAFAKKWSVVVERDENGLVGMDILFKKRF
ncbi:MAG: translocation/assembly module TamB domain-containing protein [Bryobacteraceae bacterium]|jgi:translocation and assembly module TamB